jgi:hypothetical protein
LIRRKKKSEHEGHRFYDRRGNGTAAFNERERRNGQQRSTKRRNPESSRWDGVGERRGSRQKDLSARIKAINIMDYRGGHPCAGGVWKAWEARGVLATQVDTRGKN